MKKFFYLLLAVALFGSCKAKKNYTSWENAYDTASETTENVTSNVQKNQTSDVKMSDAPIRHESVKVTHGSDVKSYCIIVGSFGNIDNAVRLREELLKQGNNGAVIMQNEQGMNRVSIASYDSEQDARIRLSEVRNSFSDAWLLMRK